MSLASSRLEAVVPSQLTIAEGNSSMPFSVATSPVNATMAVVITGVYSGLSRTTNLVLTHEGQFGESSGIFVPILLSSSGAGNSFYTSELTLVNRGSGIATLRFP